MSLDCKYSGSSRKLIFAIDVGTTYSGVSYCILDPGNIPKISSVMRYPGQEDEGGLRSTKIPTAIFYSQDGKVCAVGAEARANSMVEEAIDNDYIFVQWFKLHFHPNGKELNDAIPDKPTVKPLINIWADFLAYIYNCAKQYVKETEPAGRDILESGSEIEFVLTHPNDWQGVQQRELRRAAVIAGLIPDTEKDQSRISFLTEGEATFHFHVMNKKLSDIFKCGEAVIIVDAGGGTVDISTYKITNSSPLVRAQECAVTKCLLQGSTFVNSRAETYLREKLRHSPYGSNEDILEMLKDFEKSAKPSFKGGSRNTMIKFGSPKAPDDIERGVSRGRLSLSSKEMFALFDPSIRAIEEAITEQRQSATGSIKTILLSGGFSASPFLRARLQTYAESAGVSLYYPDTEGQSPAKAVAEGALAFYIDHCVFARMAKRTYGIQGSTMFWPFNPEHLQRIDQVFLDCEGDLCLPRHFAPVLKKGTLVTADEEFVCSFLRNTPEPIDNIQTSIVCYKGDKSNPHWTDVEPEMFFDLCTVQADVSQVPKKKCDGPRRSYYSQPFKVVVCFGLAEFKAQLSWLEDGQEKRGPASMIYEN